MDLFSNSIDNTQNILPKDGIVNYFGKIFSKTEADEYLNSLLSNIEWKNDEAVIFGKLIHTKRKAAWYGDTAFEYTYSNRTKKALPWTKELLELKAKIEKETGESFNSCLLNLYHTGEEGMAWHSDGEKDLKKNGAIGSLSFGAERKFSFKHKVTKETVSVMLEHGSLCSQWVCVLTFITSRLPCSSITDTVSLVALCLNENFRSAPKLNEPIAPSFFRSFSPSLCQAIPSSPVWYKLSRQELKLSPVSFSIFDFNAESSFVHGSAFFVRFE